jgi:hypothetical protein
LAKKRAHLSAGPSTARLGRLRNYQPHELVEAFGPVPFELVEMYELVDASGCAPLTPFKDRIVSFFSASLFISMSP